MVSQDDAELVPRRTPPMRRTWRTSPRSCSSRRQRFVALYKAGDDDAARALYAPARVHWERIETVAESFGDLDPRMDAREADLEQGQRWTGWHRIEKDLWSQRASGYTPAHAGRAGDAREPAARRHADPRRPRAQAHVHGRPDRERLPRPARGGRDGQGHRRGGVLVAHRPLGLPGERRRRAQSPSTASAGRSSKTRRPSSRPRSRGSSTTLQALLDAHRSDDGFITYDQLDPRPGASELSDGGQRALRAALAAHLAVRRRRPVRRSLTAAQAAARRGLLAGGARGSPVAGSAGSVWGRALSASCRRRCRDRRRHVPLLRRAPGRESSRRPRTGSHFAAFDVRHGVARRAR